MLRYLASLLALACINIFSFTLPDLETSQVQNQGVIYTLDSTNSASISQSFVSSHSGLNGITFWISIAPEKISSQGSLLVELYHDTVDASPLYRSVVSINSIRQNSPIRIEFPPFKDPPHQTYLLVLQAQNSVIDIRGSIEDFYPLGQAVSPLQANLGDLTFTTTYRYNFLALSEDIHRINQHLRILLIILIVLLLPGWMMIDILKVNKGLDIWEIAALSCGASLAILPIIMVWTTQLGLQWRSENLWGVLLIASIYLVYRKLSTPNRTLIPRFSLLDGLMLGIVLLVVLTRLVMIRDMVAPAWVDSIHHTWLGRLISEQGGFPQAYQPYPFADISSYHLGFHTTLAAINLLSRGDLSDELLYFGQVLNVFAILGVYLFTKSLTRMRGAALVAALAAGLFSPMPAYYTSWGRYTQLAGLMILPTAVFYWLHFINYHPLSLFPKKWSYLFFAGLASAGLFMVHYRVAGFLAALVFLILADVLITGFPPFKARLQFVVLSGLALAFLSILFILPWFDRTLIETIIPVIQQPISPTPAFGGFSWRYLNSALGWYPLVSAFVGLCLSLILRQFSGRILLAWTIILFSLANLHALNLPGGNLINNTTVAISLFLPIAALTGYFYSTLLNAVWFILPFSWRIWTTRLAVITFCLAALVGSQHIVSILNPNTYLVRQADLIAVQWVKDNIPAESTIMVNPFLWGYGVYAGADGGYWITALSGQATIPPPLLQNPTGQSEIPRMNEISRQAVQAARDPLKLHALLSTNNIDYIYLGARGGVFSPSILDKSELFVQIYSANGVRIYAIAPKSASPTAISFVFHLDRLQTHTYNR